MTPTIGRIVIYKLSESQKIQNNGADECPAIVTRVWSPTCINLKLITDGPHVEWVTSACEGDKGGQWHWPPRA